MLDKADALGAALLGEGGLLMETTRAVLEGPGNLEERTASATGEEIVLVTPRGTPATGPRPRPPLTDAGAIALTVPRDRNGEFGPRLVPKNGRWLAGFNDRILSLYARGMSVHDIRLHLAQLYGVEVSPDLTSKAPTRWWMSW
ncbi:transposase [Streptomyces sp. NPDC056480]|uniref:transposase n=1 Tax=Streptomyces sp. NPDC056480 TaxID=3345833 RepID=UPI0036B79E8C